MLGQNKDKHILKKQFHTFYLFMEMGKKAAVEVQRHAVLAS